MAKLPSKTLKRDQKYAYSQFMAAPKTVYKYAQNAMQDRAKEAITQSIQSMHQMAKDPK